MSEFITLEVLQVGDEQVTLTISPNNPHFGNPIPLKRGAVRQHINELEVRKHSQHSGEGKTIWVSQEWCDLNGIEYVVEVHKAVRVDSDFKIVHEAILGYLFRLTRAG